MNKTPALNGNAIGILGGIILSSDSLFIRLMGINDSWTIVVLRGVLMWGICLLVWLLWRQSRPVLGTPWLTRRNAPSTLFFALASACFVNALNRGSVATVLVIISATPFISALISRLAFNIRIERRVMLASLAGIAGVVVVMSGHDGSGDGAASLYALGTAVSMALAFIFTSRVDGGSAGLPSLGAALAAAAIALAAGGDLVENLKMLTPAQYGWSLAEGALIMPLAMGLITLSTRFVSAAGAGLFLLLETALAPLWIYCFMDEIPTIQAVIGGAIVILAVLSQSLSGRRRARAARCADAG